jgi:HEAT repeats
MHLAAARALPMSTHAIAPTRDGHSPVRTDLRSLDKVRGIFASLAKFVAAQAIYQSNNPNLVKFARAFEESFRSYFEDEAELLLTVSQYQLLWREQAVYDIGPNTESIAFLLYKDGVGELCVMRSVERVELDELTRILKTALYHPSTQFDIATALWQAEFASITYRVLDEQSDAAEGDGDGAGSSQREQPLRANDHQDLPASEMQERISRESDAELEPLGDYYLSLAAHAGAAGSAEHEQAMQRIVLQALRIDEQELARWSASRTQSGGDELLGFLRVMLDFTRMACPPPVIRDVTDIIERLIHYIRDEGHVATLTATLEIEKELRAISLQAPFAPLPARIHAELTDPEYLISLAHGSREANAPFDLLRYFGRAGVKAAGAVWELLSRHADDAIHERGCALLLSMEGLDVDAVTALVDVENPRLARDVVQLLGGVTNPVITPVVHRMVSAAEPQTRRGAVELLVKIPGDDSARLLATLLRDENGAVRQRAWSAAAGVSNALLAADVEGLCFAESAARRTPDELDLMFRALGRLCGYSVISRLRAMVEQKQLFTMQKQRIRREKLLAITALRYVPGADAQRILEALCTDNDTLVRTKAAHAIKQRMHPGLNDSGELSTSEEA